MTGGRYSEVVVSLGLTVHTSLDDKSSFPALFAEVSLDGPEVADAELLGGEFIDPSCMDRKYLVAAWRSCSRSSAVCLLKTFVETLSFII